jgi:Nucleoside-diphosphate-sugar epimerases
MVEKKRILITGASGFIGGFLVEEALQRGYEVWAGVRSGSSRDNLQDERIRFINLHYDDVNVLTEQLRQIVSSSGAFHYVIHNAGITKALDTSAFYKINALYTYKLIEALAEAECKPEKFLLMSSLSSYGPVSEYSLRPIRLDDEQHPDTAYGKSKLEAELFLQAQTYFPYIILRPTGVYGPGDKDYLMEIKSIKSGFDMKVGMKPQNITFIYVKDLAVAAFLALENSSIHNSSYFVADGDVYTDNEFAVIIKRLLGKKFVFNMRIPLWMCYLACACSEIFGIISGKVMTLNTDKYKILKQRNWICETEPIQKDLNFISKYNLKEGLKETIHCNKESGLL